MASWNTPSTVPVNNPLPSAYYNTVAENEVFLYQRPYILSFNSVATSCATGTNTQVTLGGLTASGYGFSVSSDYVVVPLTGIYQVSFSAELSNNGPSATIQALLVGTVAGIVLQGPWQTSTYYPFSTQSGLISANAGDQFGLYVGNLFDMNLDTVNGPTSTYLHMAFVGSA